jgi:sugar lactone lactonase YvrE
MQNSMVLLWGVLTSRIATAPQFDLAEGVIWDDRRNQLVWVDIIAGKVFRGTLGETEITVDETFDLGEWVGAVALAEDGGLLVAVTRGLAAIAPDGTVTRGPDLFGERPDLRFNDGSVDPSGRFLVGSLGLVEHTPVHELIRVSADGTVEVLRTGVTLSNGIGFSPDGATIYHVDSIAGTVSSHSYGPGPFHHDEQWVPLAIDFGNASPDGLTVAADCTLWIAQWDGWCVKQFTPGGELLSSIAIDAPQASCMGFAGPALDRMVITSGAEDMGDDRIASSGALFVADPNSEGMLTPRWAGNTSTPYRA